MNDVTYKIRVNRPCRLFIDDEEIAILDELKLAQFSLPEGEYLRKVVTIDDNTIYDEGKLTLTGVSKLENISLTLSGLETAKKNALPKQSFKYGDLYFQSANDKNTVEVTKGDYSFSTIEIPDVVYYSGYQYHVKGIGEYAFQNCLTLISVTLHNHVLYVGRGAFANCENLSSVTIHEGLSTIGVNAFLKCSSLKMIIIPNSVSSIGQAAFLGCISLKSMMVKDGNAIYDSRGDCNAIIETTANTLIVGCKSTIIPYDVTRIGRGAFCNCSSLTSITIPECVKTFGVRAFSGCTSLSSIFYSGSVAQWDIVSKGGRWHTNVPSTIIHCSDGDARI